MLTALLAGFLYVIGASGETAGIVVAAAGVLLGPLVAYLAAAKRFSGKIGTSDASDLWAESRSIRDDYKAQVQALLTEVAELKARLAAVEATNATLVGQNHALLERERGLHEEIARLRQELNASTQ